MITLLNKFDDNYLLHEKDVLEIGEHYVNENNLKLYLKNISFDNQSKYIGSYSVKDNSITLNIEKILEASLTTTLKLFRIYQINDEYRNYFINFYYLYVLFHEMEHAMQAMKYHRHDNILYQYLYELCTTLQNNDRVLYNKNHSLFPLEIDANNNGYLNAYKLLSYTKLPGRETKILYLQYLFSLLNNYQKVNKFRVLTPIEKLAKENSSIDIDKIFELLDDARLNKIERLNLGVCITPREFNSVNSEKVKILLRKDILLNKKEN